MQNAALVGQTSLASGAGPSAVLPSPHAPRQPSASGAVISAAPSRAPSLVASLEGSLRPQWPSMHGSPLGHQSVHLLPVSSRSPTWQATASTSVAATSAITVTSGVRPALRLRRLLAYRI